MLCFWLLWGDFCFVFMQNVVPTIMPLKFQALGVSNATMGLILGSMPPAIHIFLNPVISFKSDRYRGRFGRRIPFMLVTLPFIVLCLVALGHGEEIGYWLHGALGSTLAHYKPKAVATTVIEVLLVLFAVLSVIGNTVYWYLFNDVVPEHLLARFMSWFRMVSMGALWLYSVFVFKYAATHSEAIFVGAGLLYLAGFGAMCLFVKEGKYPPPPSYLDGKSGMVAAIKTYGKECHCHRLYWFMFFAAMCGALGVFGTTLGITGNPFMVLYLKDTGLELDQIGKIAGTSGLVSGLMTLASGWLADRYHPIRVVIAGQVFQCVFVLPALLVWFFWHPSHHAAYIAWMLWSLALCAPAMALIGVNDPPLLMRLFPRSRYGQFCSANAMWRAAGGITGGILGGLFLDAMGRNAPVGGRYLWLPVWQLVFQIPTVIATLLVYIEWKKLGADNYYLPPLHQTQTLDPAQMAAVLDAEGTAPQDAA
jgi:MFS family permease